MGYSTPKKQLDLKEFLSQPAKPRAKRTFGYRSQPTPEAATTEEPTLQEPASDEPVTSVDETTEDSAKA